MKRPTNEAAVAELAAALEADIIRTYGTPMVSGDALQKVLGFASSDAFRQALSRRRLPIAVFPLEGRRGKFALAKDIAQWMAESRVNADASLQKPKLAKRRS